jgi:hypothetical protein
VKAYTEKDEEHREMKGRMENVYYDEDKFGKLRHERNLLAQENTSLRLQIIEL